MATKYTYEICRELASTCRSRNEVKRKNKSAYNAICRNGWMDKFATLFGYMTRDEAIKPYYSTCAKYNPEYIRSVALRYKTYHWFATNHPYLCKIARETGQINEFTWLERNEEIKQGFSDHVYAYEFESTHTAYIGRTVRPKQRHIEHLDHKSPVSKYAKSIGVPVPAPKYLYETDSLDEGAKLECIAIEQYKTAGWNLINKLAGGSIGGLAHRGISNDTLLRRAQKFTSLRKLKKTDGTLYYHLKKRELISRCTWLVDDRLHNTPKVPRGYWNSYENCKAEAMKYEWASDFRNNCRGGYSAAMHKGWINDWQWLKPGPKPVSEPEYEVCYACAKACCSRKEFNSRYRKEYHTAKTHGWLVEWTWLVNKKVSKWDDYEICTAEAKKYTTLTEFRNNSQAAYRIARKRNWIATWDWLTAVSNPTSCWDDYSKCREEALKYNTRTAFTLGSPEAARVASKERWIYDWVWLKRKNESKWRSYDKCKEEALKYKTRKDFRNGSPAAYKTSVSRKWINDWKWLQPFNKPSGYWDIYDNCKAEAMKYNSREKFKLGTTSAYNAALRHDWLASFYWLEHKAPAGYWEIYDNCKMESMKYHSRFEFQKNARGAYGAAVKYGWLDSFTWLVEVRKPAGYWDAYEHCRNEAIKYTTKIQFKRGCYSGYISACKHKWIDTFFPSSQSSTRRD